MTGSSGHVLRCQVHTVCILKIPSHTSTPSASAMNSNELFVYIFRDWGINTQGGLDHYWTEKKKNLCWFSVLFSHNPCDCMLY